MATEHLNLWTWARWYHHGIDDKTLAAGLHCFVWMRVVKVMQLLSGIVIFKDIIGDTALERLADKLKERAQNRSKVNFSAITLGKMTTDSFSLWSTSACGLVGLYAAIITFRDVSSGGFDLVGLLFAFGAFLFVSYGLYVLAVNSIGIVLMATSIVEWLFGLIVKFFVNHVKTRDIGSYWLQSAAALLILSFLIDFLTS